jgi:hypothetical protein
VDIDELVRTKAAATASGSKNSGSGIQGSKVQAFDWQLMKDKVLYTLEITVKGGRMSMKLDPAHLGLSPDVITELSQIATGGYSARISKLHKEALTKLQSMQKQLYQRYTMFAEPFRFIVDSDLPAAVAELEKIKEEADRYRKALHDGYENELRGFLGSVAQVLGKAGIDPSTGDVALQFYADQYPSRDDFTTDSLQLVIEGPTRLTSLVDQISKDAELAKKEAERLSAELESAQKEEELSEARKRIAEKEKAWEAIQRSQMEYGELLQKAVGSAQEKATDEAYASVADIVDRCAVLEPGKLDGHVQKTWEGAFNRLQTLASFDPRIKEMVERASKIRDLFTLESPQNIIDQHMREFQDYLRSLVGQVARGEGAQKLMNCLSHDKDYKELIITLEQLESSPDTEALRSLQAKCEGVVQFFRYRQKSLERKFEAAKKADLVHRGIEKPDADKGPFDLEAGF